MCVFLLLNRRRGRRKGVVNHLCGHRKSKSEDGKQGRVGAPPLPMVYTHIPPRVGGMHLDEGDPEGEALLAEGGQLPGVLLGPGPGANDLPLTPPPRGRH